MRWAVNSSYIPQEEKKFHVFFLNCYTINALKILCEVRSFMKNNKMYATLKYLQAVRHNLVYPDYGWITWHGRNLISIPGNLPNYCTKEEVKEFIRQSRILSITLFLDPDNGDIPTASGLVRQYIKIITVSLQRN